MSAKSLMANVPQKTITATAILITKGTVRLNFFLKKVSTGGKYNKDKKM